jgi:hypothetical protein
MNEPPDSNDLEARLVAIAQTATAQQIREYQPSQNVRALAGSMFHGVAPKLIELAEGAGLSQSTVYRILKDPAAVHWIVSHGTNLASAALGAVHARLFQMAMTSRAVGPMRLYLERFDPEFKKQRVLEQGRNTQLNFIQEMTDAELGRWIKQTRTRQLGSTPQPDPGRVLPVDPREVRGSGGHEVSDDLLPAGADGDGIPGSQSESGNVAHDDGSVQP